MQEKVQPQTKAIAGKDTAGVVLSWIFSILFLITGISFISDDLIIGVCYLISGLILLPPLSRVFKGKLKIFLLIVFLGIIGIRILWSVSFLFLSAKPH